jgi:putative membrane protein
MPLSTPLLRKAAPTAAVLALGAGAAASPASAVRDARPVTARCSARQFSAADEQWLKMSAAGDQFEIAGGKVAQQRSTTQGIRDLGARLVKDHSTSASDGRKLARRLGITLPTKPTSTQQWELEAVAKFQGAEFDHWYALLEVRDHTDDISEARSAVTNSCNPSVRQMARTELPTLRKHLQLAKQQIGTGQR